VLEKRQNGELLFTGQRVSDMQAREVLRMTAQTCECSNTAELYTYIVNLDGKFYVIYILP
jgi:hypothetical protein